MMYVHKNIKLKPITRMLTALTEYCDAMHVCRCVHEYTT